MTGTERKVFQKYYPPDFDPSKIPKAERGKNRQFIQRVMAPFNMQCGTCSEYIYKGRKFNMKRETAEGETYLGMKIFRFHFRCPNCLAEISFKTDLENVDYAMEHGATRLFDAYKLGHEKEKEQAHEEEEEKADAMKMLEKKTRMSKIEMEASGQIDRIQEMNRMREKALQDRRQLPAQSTSVNPSRGERSRASRTSSSSASSLSSSPGKQERVVSPNRRTPPPKAKRNRHVSPARRSPPKRPRYDSSPPRYRSRDDRRHDERDNPQPCEVLGVFGLSYRTDEKTLRYEFSEYADVRSIKLVKDYDGRSRGYGFVTFYDTKDATTAKDMLSGKMIDGVQPRIDYCTEKHRGAGRRDFDRSPIRDQNARRGGGGDRGSPFRKDRSPIRRRRGSGDGRG